MSQHRKKWRLEDKLAAVQLMKSKGVSESSRAYNVSTTTLYKWEKLYDEQGSAGLSDRKKTQSAQEISRLEREVRELKMIVAEKELALRISNELLKKSK